MNGPWQALRWWRPAPDGLGAIPAGVDPTTWERRIGWGWTPEAVHSLLTLVGVPDDGRKMFTSNVSLAVREAAAFSVMLGRCCHGRYLVQHP